MPTAELRLRLIEASGTLRGMNPLAVIEAVDHTRRAVDGAGPEQRTVRPARRRPRRRA
jgi:hypothetical protein